MVVEAPDGRPAGTESDEPHVRAGGGVVYRRSGKRHEILLVHRPRYDDWTLPKGKLEVGESWRDGAWREVWEETGLSCAVGPKIAVVRYLDAQGRTKEVRYFVMEPDGDDRRFVPNEEVDEVRWLDLDAAAAALSYERDAIVLDAFRRWASKG